MCDDEVWHKSDSESEEQYNWFGLYLELGPDRKITMLPELYGNVVPDITRLNKTSSENDWVSRAKAYDEYQVVKRRKKFEARLDKIMEHEFDELESAYETSHILRERIENDKQSSTYSLLNGWKNWVEAHNKITEEMYRIAGKPKDENASQIVKAIEQTEETKIMTDADKIAEVTKSLRMIQSG